MKSIKKISYIMLAFVLFVPMILLAEEETPTPTPEVTPTPTAEVKVPMLNSLGVVGHNLGTLFNPVKTTYELTVSSTITKVTVEAVADNNSVIISGNGIVNLTDTEQKVNIVVALKSDNTKRNTYQLTIKREKSNLTLKSLKINGFAFEEEFNEDVTRYKVEVPYNVKNLDVVAVSNDPNMEVVVSGDKDLIVGSNNVLVTITNTNTKESKIYTIVTNRLREEKENTTSNITSEAPVVTNKDNSNAKLIIIIVGIVLLIILSGLGIFFYLKTKKPKVKKIVKKEVEEIIEEPTDIIEELEEIIQKEAEDVDNITTKEVKIDRPDIIDEIDSLFSSEEK